jgi:uncharacterized protein (TIGR00255 family)
VNVERAREIVTALEELKRALDLPGQIDLGFVARQPEVFTVPLREEIQVDAARVGEIVDQAIGEVAAMREREGSALGEELRGLLEELAEEAQRVGSRAPHRLESERDRLRQSVAELLDEGRLDEARLSQEIALLADKLDITEELVRLRSHIAACVDALDGVEPVGKKLTFLGQEMLREINTIGSKANDSHITRSVIAMKGTIEKFREQVENVE